jgi:hypothetical protein
MNNVKLLNRLRRQRFRQLGIAGKWCVVSQSASHLAGFLVKVGSVLLAIAAIGFGLRFSSEPLAILLVGNAWLSLVLVQSVASSWENRAAMHVEPAIAFRCVLPIADEKLFRIWYWMILYQHSGLAIIIGSSWLWAVAYIEADTWKWCVATVAAIVQIVLVTGLGCWAARNRWVNRRRLWFTSVLCMFIFFATVLFGSAMKFWSLGLFLLPLPDAWPGFALLWLQTGTSWWWSFAWLIICSTLGGWMCVTSYRCLAKDFVVRELTFLHGRPCWMVTEYGYELWRDEIDKALIPSAKAPLVLDPTVALASDQLTTRESVSAALTTERLQESYWDHVGCFTPIVQRCLTQREQFLASMVRRSPRSWQQQWMWDASLCLLAALIASIFATQHFAGLVSGAIGCVALYHVRDWPFFAEDLLKLPTSISEILWLQTKLLWLRLVAWTPLILISALIIASLAGFPTDSTLLVAGKLLFTAVLSLPVAQLIHFLSVGHHPWLRWSVLFRGIAFAISLVIAVLGTFLLLTTQMPLSLSGAVLQCAGIVGFLFTGCRWFDRGCFDLR